MALGLIQGIDGSASFTTTVPVTCTLTNVPAAGTLCLFFASSSGTTRTTAAAPTGVANAAGWVALLTNGGTYNKTSVWYCAADGVTKAASLLGTSTTANLCYATLMAVSGGAATSGATAPTLAAEKISSTSAVATNAITCAIGDFLVVFHNRTSRTVGTDVAAPFTTDGQVGSSQPYLSSGHGVATGTSHTGTWTLSNTSSSGAWGIRVQPAAIPTVTESAVTSIASTTATGNGNATVDGGNIVTDKGVCWNTSANPTTANNKVSSGATDVGAFTAALTSLPAGALIYTRAYASNLAGTGYNASDVTFNTLAGAVVMTRRSDCSMGTRIGSRSGEN